MVVVHHGALALPGLAAQVDPAASARTSAEWWLTYTPAHLLWAGGEAVTVFFVLSGLVLVLPYLRPGRSGTWLPYYAKRALRLYVPVICAVALAGVLVVLFPRTVDPAQSWWMNAHAGPVQMSDLGHDAGLLAGTGWANSALWSLRYEVFFSLLLPVVVVVVRRMTVPLWLSVPVVLAGCGAAAHAGEELVSYLLVFVVGALLAQQLTTLRTWAAGIDRSSRSAHVWAVLGAAGALALLAAWWVKQVVSDVALVVAIGRPAGVLGAAILVFCFLHCPSLRSFGDARPLQWLGTVSFSLYLVHEPIVVSVATLLPPTAPGVLVVLVVSVPVSLAAAVVFHRLVERPSQRLAGWAGRLAGSRVAPGKAPAQTVPVPATRTGVRQIPVPARGVPSTWAMRTPVAAGRGPVTS